MLTSYEVHEDDSDRKIAEPRHDGSVPPASEPDAEPAPTRLEALEQFLVDIHGSWRDATSGRLDFDGLLVNLGTALDETPLPKT